MNGYRATPQPVSTGRTVTCWRCGVDMPRPADTHHIQDAPCRDCREALAHEGVPRSQWQIPKRRAAA